MECAGKLLSQTAGLRSTFSLKSKQHRKQRTAFETRKSTQQNPDGQRLFPEPYLCVDVAYAPAHLYVAVLVKKAVHVLPLLIAERLRARVKKNI